MPFDFTTVMDRRGKDAIAVDLVGKPGGFAPDAPKEGFDFIPMWVADMNFPVLPTITDALQTRISHPAFGYFSPSEEYYNAIIRWQQTRNSVTDLRPEHIGYENGVLGGVVSAMNIFCSRGDRVLVHAPTYIGFTGSLENAGYKLVHSPLVQDDNGIWRMNFADMEEKLKNQNIHAAVFCSPHNPTGRVWERWEVEQVMALFQKYDVQVVSDEIWSDIILTGHRHTPTQSVSNDARNRTVALYAPSKTFNLAGLVGSYHIIYNDALRHRHLKESSLSHYNSMNVLSMHALLGAYQPEGYAWVDALCQVITKNVDYACDFIAHNFPGIRVSRPQGTYMLFLDCEDWCKTHNTHVGQLLKAGWDVGVGWQDGRPFHGPHHIRMNLALPLSRVQEAMARLQKYVFCK
ncbi:MAG: aminotransferase class I/II-fold pyridoxal phosphate-dependent enzyme [Oscillospiraceae bacterium]|nr:aminotransferase class I/II-fold pyridoxal phosphate-dependent enzyme [Oscillospiraceae bacterium]